MSSVVFNANAVNGNNNSIEHLFPTTIGGATKMYQQQRYQHIMPAPEQQQQQQSLPTASNGLTIKTRKYTPRGMALANATPTALATASSTMPYNVDQSQSVQRRNARERNRVKQVNNSFARLRQHIPQSIIADLTKGGGRGPHKKISKVDTLRIAVEYIRRLQDLVDDLNGGPTVVTGNSSQMVQQLNLCLDETSSNSSHSSSGSSSVSHHTHHIYNYNSHSNASNHSSHSNHSNLPTLLQQQQQLQRQQFPNHPLTPITLNGNTATLATFATQQQQLQQQQQQQLQQQQPATTMLTTGLLATATGSNCNSSSTTTGACHSPTSSFNSSMSFDSGTYEAAPQQLSPPVPPSSSSSSSSSHSSNSSSSGSSSAALDAQLQLKFEPYEHFQLDEEDCTPDDEEILDYISLWQEQ